MGKKIIGLLFIIAGAHLMLERMGIDYLEWLHYYEWRQYLLPAVIILIGLMIFFGNGSADKKKAESMRERQAPESSGDPVKIAVAFSGNSYNYAGQHFDGAKVDVLLGGAKLDLRDAILPDNCLISVAALMGGADIYLPSDVSVKIDSNSMLGGVDNKHTNPSDTTLSKTVVIKANCLFGGVEIK